LKIYITQAIVATQLRCGCGIFSNHFVINFTHNVQVKKFEKTVIIWRRYGQKFAAYFFDQPLIIKVVTKSCGA